MPAAQETVLEIDLSALERNYRFLRNSIRPQTRFLGVTKAFAYGHDALAVASRLEAIGADYLAVAYAQEGIHLRQGGIKMPILVLHPAPVNFREIMEYGLEPSLYTRRVLEAFMEAAQQAGKKEYPVHLKFNTGLNRLGFSLSEALWVAEKLRDQGRVRPVTVFSHLAASEDPEERPFTETQIRDFDQISEILLERLPHAPLRHLLNTSGILNYPEAQYEMVRSGIGLYGFGNEARADSRLEPVATLKTVISQLHTVRAGESVGYNRAYLAKKEIRMATLPLGHADGIGRQYGMGRGFVYVNGTKAPLIGNVCMDMIMVDVSGITCREGDEVIVFGKEASAEALAAAAGTISYELLTGISRRIKRVILP